MCFVVLESRLKHRFLFLFVFAFLFFAYGRGCLVVLVAGSCGSVCVCVNFTCLRNRCLNLKRGHSRRPHEMPDTLLMLVLLFISCFTIAWTTQVVLEFWFESARAASGRQFFQTGFPLHC